MPVGGVLYGGCCESAACALPTMPAGGGLSDVRGFNHGRTRAVAGSGGPRREGQAMTDDGTKDPAPADGRFPR